MDAKNTQPVSMAGLCERMLSSRIPMSDDTETAMVELGLRPTCAACIVFSMIQKACKGDTSAAKFLNELSGASTEEDDGEIMNLSALSDALLYRLAGSAAFLNEEPQAKRKRKQTEKQVNG